MRAIAIQHQHGSRWRGSGLALAVTVLLLYAVVAVLAAPEFLSLSNITSLLFSVAVLLPITLGMQSLLLLGKFDLSVGATGSLAGMVSGLVFSYGGNGFAAIACGLMVGVLAGLVNGQLVARLRVDPLIATLGTMGIMRSLALASNDGRIVAGLPATFSAIASSYIRSINLLLPIGLAVVLLAEVSFRHLALFRRFYAVGDNPAGADRCGIRVMSTVIFGYVLAASGAAATGIIQLSRTLSASPNLFDDLALTSIAACILGGSSLRGGVGTMTGAVVGTLVVASTRNLVVLLGIPVYWKDLAVGVLLIVSVCVRYSPRDLLRWISQPVTPHRR